MNSKQQLQTALTTALANFEIENAAPESLQIVPATNPQFGDYQWNGALALAKLLKQKPRDIAQQVLENIEVSALCEPPEIAGAGFLNFRLKTDFLQSELNAMKNDARLGVAHAAIPKTVVVDFSSPNVAKPMHVGHIRSTIIGDAIARLLRFKGHKVITDNHIGDWGTAFGKIIIGWKENLDENALASDPLGEMERIYRLVNEKSKTDPQLEARARRETALLQTGDAQNRAIWERARELSQAQFDEIYGLLNIEFDFELGESFYNPFLESVVGEAVEKGVARESQGAIAIFSAGKIGRGADPFWSFKDGEWVETPAIIRKSDGAATYATTDLATLDYRLQEWRAEQILYVTDARQERHFRQVFDAFERANSEQTPDLRHVAFGMILGDDKKPLKTRDGENVKLRELLDEARQRSYQKTRELSPHLPEEIALQNAPILGVAVVKYADLSQNRATDYQFSWEKMLSEKGNSAIYLEYAFARTQSVLRKAGDWSKTEIQLEANAEIALAKVLLRFDEAIENALKDWRPHLLCDYLYELAGALSAFWRDCRVLDSPQRNSRLALVELTGKTLEQGLNLLGIQTIEQM